MVDHSSEKPAVNDVNFNSAVFAAIYPSFADSAGTAVTAGLFDNQAVIVQNVGWAEWSPTNKHRKMVGLAPLGPGLAPLGPPNGPHRLASPRPLPYHWAFMAREAAACDFRLKAGLQRPWPV